MSSLHLNMILCGLLDAIVCFFYLGFIGCFIKVCFLVNQSASFMFHLDADVEEDEAFEVNNFMTL